MCACLSMSLSSSVSVLGCVPGRPGECEGVNGSCPSTGLHPSTSEHVLPAHTCSTDPVAACMFHSIWNSVICLWSLVSAELSSLFWQLPIPLVVPPEKKDVKDAAVQSESLTEDKQIDVPVSAAGMENVWFSSPKHHISVTLLRKAIICNISIVQEFKKL